MTAALFLAFGIFFFWMLFKAFYSEEIKARGWGFSVRTYYRNSEPVWYWVTFTSYLVCAVWATAFGVMALLHMLSK